MLIQLKLGIPSLNADEPLTPLYVNLDEVASVFPYGQLMPIQSVIGGLTFNSGRVVPELGDTDDTAVIVAAAISIGYHDPDGADGHKIYSTADGH
jgi:uncharacterized protein (TIGR02058 family)